MSTPDQSLQILIDVRSRLDEVVKAQAEFRRLGQEATSTSNVLKTGFLFEVGRRGLGLLTASLQESVMQAFRLADAIEDGARNLEISQEAYQVLGNVIREAGGDVSLLQQAVSTNNRSLTEARNTTSAAAVAYRQLGLNAKQLEQLPVERRFELIGKAVLRATDKTEAFTAASQLLGSRNIPTLLGALKDLAEQGYDRLTVSMKASGKVMSDETIGLLARANKQVEEFKAITLPIAAGTAIGWAQSAMDYMGGNIANLLNVMQGLPLGAFNRTTNYTPPKPPVAPANDTTPLEQTAKWRDAQFALLQAQNAQALVENDVTLNTSSRKAELIRLLWDEYHAREALLSLAQSTSTNATFTDDQKRLLIEKLQADFDQIELRKQNLMFEQSSFRRRAQDPGWLNTENRLANKNHLNIGEGVAAGIGDWVTELGSRGEQVAVAMQSSIGTTVDAISEGIYGWITGTQSFGQVLMQLGATILQTILHTIVQMGVQMLINATIGQAIHAAAMASALASVAALAPPVAALWAGPATLATIATLGGAAIAAPPEIATAMGLVIGSSVLAAAEGGLITGPGTGTSDSIPTLLSNGEYVLTAATTKRLGTGFLDALNTARPLPASSAPTAFGGTAGAAGGTAHAPALHVYMDEQKFMRSMQENNRDFFIRLMEKQQRSNA